MVKTVCIELRKISLMYTQGDINNEAKNIDLQPGDAGHGQAL